MRIHGAFCTSIVTFAGLALGAGGARGDVYPVDLSDEKFTLYEDPNTGAEVKLGGFSGLVPAFGVPNGRVFHVITDRGPSVDGPGGTGKAFVAPDYSPSIVTVLLRADSTAQILKVLPLRKPGGNLISGLPNACNSDDAPVTDLSGNTLARDPDGQDVEGLTAGPFGTFWICEEYLPSVSLVGPSGTVLLRLVPEGARCGGEVVPTFELLPAILRKRVTNRGFEGLALASNGRLYVTLQRPLANPNRAASEASRNIRLVEIDLPNLLAGRPGAVRQLLYLTQGTANRSILLSDLYSIDPDVLLVTERRTDKIFSIRISSATDITALEDHDGKLLTPYQSDPSVAPKTTIEQLTETELAAIGVTPLKKAEVFSGLKAIDPALDKVEGLALVGNKLVVCADNDFNLLGADFSTTPATLVFQDPPNQPKIFTIQLNGVPVP
jgi:phytase-like protein